MFITSPDLAAEPGIRHAFFTREGGVTVTIANVTLTGGRAEGEVRPPVPMPQGEYVMMRVSDTGIGIPPQAQEKLFAKFFRAENARDVRPDGTGLGLYLTKKFVETMGGFITAESKEGEGSTFTVCVPLECSAAAQQVTSSTADAAVAACRT